MRSSTINYVAVGIFVLAILAGLGASIALLSGRTGPTDRYFTNYTDVSGLKFGTQVLFMGYPVGQVEAITPMWDKAGRVSFEMTLSVAESWPIPKDSIATIRASGLLASPSVDIRAGKSKDLLSPGGMIPGQEKVDVFTALSDTANTIRDLTEQDVKPLINNLKRYVDSFGGVLEDKGGNLISDLSVIANQLAQNAPAIIENFLAVSKQVKTTGEQLNQIIGPDNADKIDKTLANIQHASANVVALTADENLARTIENVNAASQNIRAVAGRIGDRLDNLLGDETVKKVRTALDDVGAAARNVATLSKELKSTRTQLDSLLSSVEGVVGDNRAQIGESVEHLRSILQTISRHIDAVSYNLEGTSRNMFEFSRQVRQNPGLLLGGKPPVDRAALPVQ